MTTLSKIFSFLRDIASAFVIAGFFFGPLFYYILFVLKP